MGQIILKRGYLAASLQAKSASGISNGADIGFPLAQFMDLYI